MSSGIQGSQLKCSLQLRSSLSKLWSQVLAVAAPRGKKLYQPWFFAVVHEFLEVGVCEGDHRVLATLKMREKVRRELKIIVGKVNKLFIQKLSVTVDFTDTVPF